MRERRARLGELVQIDGYPFDWFEGRADRCTLPVFIDDATGKLVQLRFAPTETLLGDMIAWDGTSKKSGYLWMRTNFLIYLFGHVARLSGLFLKFIQSGRFLGYVARLPEIFQKIP